MLKKSFVMLISSLLLVSTSISVSAASLEDIRSQLDSLNSEIKAGYKEIDSNRENLQKSLDSYDKYYNIFLNKITSMVSQTSISEDDKYQCWYYSDCMYFSITDCILFDRNSSIAYDTMLFDIEDGSAIGSSFYDIIQVINSAYESYNEEAKSIRQDTRNTLSAAFKDNIFDDNEYLQLIKNLIQYCDFAGRFDQRNSGTSSRAQELQESGSSLQSRETQKSSSLFQWARDSKLTKDELINKINALSAIQKSALRNLVSTVIDKKNIGLDDGDNYSSMLSINLSDLSDDELQWLLTFLDENN